jgi:putative ABC transport system permease protein
MSGQLRRATRLAAPDNVGGDGEGRMLKLSLRGLLAHKLRFALTTFAVVMGVGFVVGAFVVTDSLRSSVDDLFANISKGIDVSVRAETGLGGGQDVATSRGRVPEELVETVRGIEGVRLAEGSISGYAQLLDKEGEPVTTTGAPFLGVSVSDEEELFGAVELDAGQFPVGPGEVAIDAATADEYGFAVGDTTRVLLVDGSQPEVTIAGIFTFGDANNLLGARLTAFDADVAQEIFGAPGQFDTIDVAVDEGADVAEVAARIQQQLPEGFEAVPTEEVVEEGSGSVEGFVDGFQNVLLGFAAVSLFVAAFYINNTFAIILGQRTREMALLRALGASPAQVTRSVVGEAVVVGVLASLIGVGFGLLIASGLRAVLEGAGFGLPAGSVRVAPRTWLAAGVVGIGVTVLAALSPARRAATIKPIEGMRDTPVLPRWSGRTRAVVGIVLLGLGGASLLYGLFGAEGALPLILFLGGGGLGVFLGVAILSPLIAVPFVGTLGRPAARLFGVASRLARANAMRNPDRTARTASALMVGLALVTAVFVVGTSIRNTFAASIDDAVQADFLVSTESFTGFSPELTAELDELPELGAVTGVRFDRFLFEGHEADLVAVDPLPAAEVVDVDLQEGSFDDLGPGSIFVHEDPAGDLDLAIGDPVEVEFASGGPQEAEVAGIYGDATWAGNYLIDLATFAEHYPANQLDQFVFAEVGEGVSAGEAEAAMEAVLEDHPQVELEDREEFAQSQEEQLTGVLAAINGLLALALVIALLGIANTLALSVLERTREIGLLRAVGMNRRQTRRMVLAEAVTVSLFGAILGVVVGVLIGMAMAVALPESVVTGISVPVGPIVVIVILAAIAGVVAGLLPARRAARLDVLRAIAAE